MVAAAAGAWQVPPGRAPRASGDVILPLMPRYIHSPHYRVDIGPHVFPTRKYDLLRRRLLAEDGARDKDFVEPEPAAEEDILAVHTPEYYEKCRDDRLSVQELWQLELPWSPELFDASRRCVQGSILAARMALSSGVGMHLGGGFHHAFSDHGEGFCVFNDPACAVRRAQADGSVQRAIVIDCDLHQGNGTAAIFAGDDSVATFSIHQEHLYPMVKPPSDVDVGLEAGTGDDRYLELLERHLLPLVDDRDPELAVFVAGADPYEHDQLGSLALTIDGLRRRDELVVEVCERRDLPLVVVLAGGYAHDTDDTIAIHLQTLRAARALWRDGERD